jgi:hypothetical protein
LVHFCEVRGLAIIHPEEEWAKFDWTWYQMKTTLFIHSFIHSQAVYFWVNFVM